MSDRVAFVGGGTSGRDHFPFGTFAYSTVGTPPERHRNNIPLTLDHAMEIYLRVKKWRINVTGVLLPYPPGHSMNGTGEWNMGEVGHFSGGSYVIDSPAYTREAELVQGRPDFLTPLVVTNTGATNISLQLDLMLFQLYFDGTSFFPSISIAAGTHCSTLRPGGTSGTHLGDFKIELSGGVILTDTGGTYEFDGSVHSATTTMTAIEWWPYELRDGSPVWDSATGVQLEDPLTDYDVGDIQEVITGISSGVPSTLVVQRNPSSWLAV